VLTQTAWNILAYYERQEKSGALTLNTAQNLARMQLKDIRFGTEGKDYFWINDLHPRMVMHPYRPDLEGQDISNFSDPNGKYLFIDFVNVVKKGGEGYVPYMWQWKDDPERITEKLSYVKLFEPWGWIIGTGFYVEEIHAEIVQVSQALLYSLVIILVIIILISFYVIKRSYTELDKRLTAENELKKYHESLEELVEERTAELQEALSNVKTLSGLLPICASCKKVRDDKGYWNQIEGFIESHSTVQFSHGLCKACADELYGDEEWYQKRKKRKE